MADRPPLRTALALALAPAVALGLARFAYALLLPAMRDDLRWTYTAAGALNTANAAGYLLGATASAGLARLAGKRRAFLAATLVTAAAIAATGVTASYPLLLAIRAIAGFTGAVVFVVGGSITAEFSARLDAARATLAVGVFFGGAGLGILASAAIVPAWLERFGEHAWPTAWWALGALSLAAFALIAAHAPPDARAPVTAAHRERPAWTAFWPTYASYFLFGTGYVSYMTFVVAFLRRAGLGTAAIAEFWATLGLAAFLSSWTWRAPIQRYRAATAIPLVLLVLACGAILPVLSAAPAATFASGALFGSSFLAVIGAITALVRRTLPPAAWTTALGAFTVAFSAGQMLGPIVTGALADTASGLRAGLAGSAALLVIAAAVAATQAERAPSRPRVVERRP